MTKKEKLAYAATAVMVIATGSNIMQVHARTKFERLRIAPVQSHSHYYKQKQHRLRFTNNSHRTG